MHDPNQAKLTPRERLIIWLGFSLFALSYMSIKLSVPALPVLSHVFHVSPLYLKISGACFLVCLALSQIWWGGVARFLDRRHIIFLGLAIAMIGTICAMLAVNIRVFIIGRCIEAIGVGVAAPTCRVLMADTLSHHQMARISIFFGVIFNFAPFVAPTLGQYLLLYASWRMIFAVFLVLLLIYYFFFFLKLPETRKTVPEHVSVRMVLENYHDILVNRDFWLYIIPFIIFVGTLLSYYMSIPFWYWSHFNVNEHYYTALALITAIPNITAYYYARFVIKRYGTKKTLIFAALISAFSLPCAILFAVFYHPSVLALICPLVIWSTAGGLAQPAVNAAILNHFRHNPGPASGLLPVLPFIFASMMFLIWSNLSFHTLWPFVSILAALVVCSLAHALFLWRQVRRHTR